jgi:ADP-ribose pyrophosphatase YjhB (NUDIX family)
MEQPYYWLNEIKKILAIAQTGLAYGNNPYDQDRYNHLVEISQNLLKYYTDNDFEKIKLFFSNEKGYITPKVDIRAVIFDNRKILMVKERIDGLWSIPGGWADVGLTPFGIAIKETNEESGLNIISERVLAIMDNKCHQHPPSLYYTYKIFIQCKVIGGQLKPGMETRDVKYFDIDDLPPLSVNRITANQINILWNQYQNSTLPIYCD